MHKSRTFSEMEFLRRNRNIRSLTISLQWFGFFFVVFALLCFLNISCHTSATIVFCSFEHSNGARESIRSKCECRRFSRLCDAAAAVVVVVVWISLFRKHKLV